MKIFAERLKELRQEHNLSQKEFGKSIGATYSAISYWESNTNEPKISYIVAICTRYGITADYLLGLEDETGEK